MKPNAKIADENRNEITYFGSNALLKGQEIIVWEFLTALLVELL